MTQSHSPKSLAIIGSGASGLVSSRHLKHLFPHLTIFEKTNTLGGTWKYRPKEDPFSSHNVMYKSLHTNLSKHIMAFLDFPFREEVENFPPHRHVLKYLSEYAENFQLNQYIRYETEVLRLERTIEKRWKIVSRRLTDQMEEENEFDAVVIANGHYFDPYQPSFEGVEECDNLMHSSTYKTMDWHKKRFVLVGVGPSGGEIARELAEEGGNEVFLVARKMTEAPPKIEYSKSGGSLTWIPSGIERIEDKGHKVIFDNGTVVENVSNIMLCTGYNYSFPFLKDSTDPETGEPIIHVTKNNRVKPLYKHCVHTKFHHSLFFVGLPFRTIPFPLAEFQALFIKHILENKVNLPLDEKNQLPEDTPQTKKQAISRYFHDFSGGYQWDYCNDLAKDCGMEGVNPLRVNIYDEIHHVRHNFVDVDFRKYHYDSIDKFEQHEGKGRSA